MKRSARDIAFEAGHYLELHSPLHIPSKVVHPAGVTIAISPNVCRRVLRFGNNKIRAAIAPHVEQLEMRSHCSPVTIGRTDTLER